MSTTRARFPLAVSLLVIGVVLLPWLITTPLGIALIIVSVILFRRPRGSLSGSLLRGASGLLREAGGISGVAAVQALHDVEEEAQRQRRERAVQNVLEHEFRQALADLARLRTGAAGLVALRNVDVAAVRAFGDAGGQKSNEAVARLGIDRSVFLVPPLGVLEAHDGTDPLEVYHRWVIRGQVGHDVDAATRMVVRQDTDAFGSAEVLVTGAGWSMRMLVDAAWADEAHRIAERFLLRDQGRSSEAAEPTAAERLQQLSDLRFQRILSDEEFQEAKERILGLDPS